MAQKILDLEKQKSRVYNKKGQKLTSFKHEKAILKKGTSFKYAKTVLPIVDPTSKRYAFHNATWNWYYLPYITIKSKEYFAVKHGGYIKANNVDNIGGCSLYTSELVFKAAKGHGQGAPVFNSNDWNTIITNLKKGQRVTLDWVLDGSTRELNSFYCIKGTNNFVVLDKTDVKGQLLPYSDKTTVLMINDSYLYTQEGHKFINQTPLPNTNDFEKNNANWRIQLVPQVSKGTICTVTKAIALWVPEERRTSSFYQLENGKIFSILNKKSEN